MRGKTGANVRVFVVWEPVLATDWETPSAALTANVPDGRARHYWDHDHRLSAALGGVGRVDTASAQRRIAFKMTKVIWDAAFVYPPGVEWGTEARLVVAPVVKYREDLAGNL